MGCARLGRADLGIGASGDAPAGRSFATRVLGRAEMRFVAAPFHPICGEPCRSPPPPFASIAP
jgi:DNA-binding transcriptional LysR family regulator